MKKFQVLAVLFALFAGLCYSEDLISKYNYHFERKEYEQALSICEELLVAEPKNLDLHREKAKMLGATNQREKFIQEMLFIRNLNNPENGKTFFSILSHSLVTKPLRDDLRRVLFEKQDTEILLRWPKFTDDKVVDCSAISESLKSPVENSFSPSNSSARQENANEKANAIAPIAKEYMSVDFDDLILDIVSLTGKKIRIEALGYYNGTELFLVKEPLNVAASIHADISNLPRDKKKYILQNLSNGTKWTNVTVYGKVSNAKLITADNVEW